MKIADARLALPALADLDDADFVRSVQELYYPETPVEELAKELGVNLAASTAAKPPPASAFESAADSVLALGSGVASGVGMLASTFGADNAVAQGANKLAQGIDSLSSDERKAEKAARNETIKAAEESGSTWEEIKANLGAFKEAPLDTLLGAVGTSAPTLLSAFIPGLGQANAARLVVQGAMGAAQGVGAVKGAIYEAVERALIEQGYSEDDAKKVAAGAQAYDSENAGSIAAGGALGVVAGTTGAEAILARIAGRAGGSGVARGTLANMAKGAAKEMPTEAAQGGQERLASNMALQDVGVETPTWKGVAGQATIEGVAGAGMGAGFGAFDRTAAATPAPGEPAPGTDPVETAVRAAAPVLQAPTVDDAIATAMEAVQRGRPPTKPMEQEGPPDPMMAKILALPMPDRMDAKAAYDMLNQPQVPQGVRRYNSKLLDEILDRQPGARNEGETLTGNTMAGMLGQQFDPTAGAMVASGRAVEEDRNQRRQADVTVDAMTREAADDLQGVRTFEPLRLPRKTPTLPPIDAVVQPGDILTPRTGSGFTQAAANLKLKALRKDGKDADLIEVQEGGFLIRPKKGPSDESQPDRTGGQGVAAPAQPAGRPVPAAGAAAPGGAGAQPSSGPVAAASAVPGVVSQPAGDGRAADAPGGAVAPGAVRGPGDAGAGGPAGGVGAAGASGLDAAQAELAAARAAWSESHAEPVRQRLQAARAAVEAAEAAAPVPPVGQARRGDTAGDGAAGQAGAAGAGGAAGALSDVSRNTPRGDGDSDTDSTGPADEANANLQVRQAAEGERAVPGVPRGQPEGAARQEEAPEGGAGGRPADPPAVGQDAPEARWTRMTATDREALLRNRTAAKAKAAERIANTAWADLASGWQKAIERAMREQDAAAPVKQDSKPVSLRERLTAMREDAVRRQEAGDDSAKAIIQPAIDILDEELAKLPVDQPRDPESGQFVAEPATMRREDRLMTREEAIEFLVGNGHILKNAETEFEEEVWLERRAEGETYVVKSREKGALATFTKGPAGAARERWSAQGAAQRAVEGMRFKEAEAAPASANLKWGRATAAERREMLAAAGYTDADQARVLSGTSWSDLTDPVRKALDKKPAVTQALAEPAPPDERALQLLNKRAMSLRSLASCLKG